MKIINNYNLFNEGKVNPKKLTYSLAGKAWNEIWISKKFKWMPKNPHIIIELNYNEENDSGLVEVFEYGSNGSYPGYKSLGTKYFRPIDEERKDFIKWLEELNLIIK